MKVLVVVNSISRNAGGLFYSVKNLSKSVKGSREGIQIEVVGVEDGHTREDLGSWEGLDVSYYPRTIPGGYGFSYGLLKAALSKNYDVLHLHGVWCFSSFVALVVMLFRRKKIVVSPRGMVDRWILENSALLKKIHYFLIEGPLFKNAKLVHALNESEADSIRAICPQCRVGIYPNGFESIVVKNKPSKECFEKKRMVFISRIDPKKGVKELVEAWGRVREADRSGWLLDIYGWGGKACISELEELLDGSVGKSIKYHGSVYGRDKDRVLKDADAFILPSYSEGLPMAVLEAWAYSVPVLMTRECNLALAFDLGAAVEIEIESLSEHLEYFLSLDEDVKSVMVEKGRDLLEEEFLWSQIGRKFSLAYKEMV